MASDLDPEKFHRTDDMALVTFLKMEGHTAQQVAAKSDTVYWWFRLNDDLEDAIAAFDGGDARVEPREYNRTFGLTKKEFYGVKDNLDQRVGEQSEEEPWNLKV